MKICNAEIGDSIFLACGKTHEVEKILSIARDKIAKDLNLIRIFTIYCGKLLMVLKILN